MTIKKSKKNNKSNNWKKGVILVGISTLLAMPYLSYKYNASNNKDISGMHEAIGEITSPIYAEDANGEWKSYHYIYEITYQYEDENYMLLVVPDKISKNQVIYQSLSNPEMALVATTYEDDSADLELKTGCMDPDYNDSEFSKMVKIKGFSIYKSNTLLPLEDTILIEDEYYEENNSLGRK